MIASVLLFVAAPLPAQANGTPPPAAPKTVDEDKLVCKRSRPVGSNIASRKQCFTRKQWDQMARESQAVKRSTEQAWTTPNQ